MSAALGGAAELTASSVLPKKTIERLIGMFGVSGEDVVEAMKHSVIEGSGLHTSRFSNYLLNKAQERLYQNFNKDDIILLLRDIIRRQKDMQRILSGQTAGNKFRRKSKRKKFTKRKKSKK